MRPKTTIGPTIQPTRSTVLVGQRPRNLNAQPQKFFSVPSGVLVGALVCFVAWGPLFDLFAQEPKVVTERLRGQWRKQDDYRFRITGRVTVNDANTVAFADGTRATIAGGADAPDLGQYARINGTFYPCGKEAAEFLKNLIADRPVSLYVFVDAHDRDAQNRVRGACFVGETDLGMELVRNGWALAHHSGATPYEIMARSNKRGLWRGEFVIPEEWRMGKRLPGEPQDSSRAGKALAALREFDAIVRVDEKIPDRPIVAVEFRPNVMKKPNDGHLALLENFPHLRSVGFSSNPITDAGLEHLGRLTELEEVNLNWSKVTPAGVLRLIKDRKKLRRLELSGVDLHDEDLTALQPLTSLELLNLRSTLITDNGVAKLQSLTHLRILNISTNRGHISDAALEALKPMTSLERLDLDRTAITDAGLAHLKDMRQLLELQVAHTAITDAGLEHLQKLSKLRSLNSTGTKVTWAGREKLAKALPLLDNSHQRVSWHYAGNDLTKITGRAEVLDAHTLRFKDGTEIELNGGMDAPELDQKGRIGDSFYPLGREAFDFLKSLVGDRPVTYYYESRRGNKLHGDCFVGETCVQIEMVRNGWAVSHHTGMDSWQMIASENKRGLWRGKFVLPEQWRKGERLPGELSRPSSQNKSPIDPLVEVETLPAFHAEGLSFSSDGKLLSATCGDREPALAVWDLARKEKLFTGEHTGDARWCRAVVFSPHGEMLASADDAGAIKLWNVSSRAHLATLYSRDEDTTGLAFLPDGKTLLRGCSTGIEAWDLTTRQERALWKGRTEKLSSLAISNDGRMLASGSTDGVISLWDAAKGKEMRTLIGHGKRVRALAFSPDGKSLASGGWDKVVKLWDIATGMERFTLKGHPGPVMSACFAPDSNLLATGSQDGTVKLWDAHTGENIVSLKTGGLSLAFSPDGAVLATGAGDGPISLWRLRTK
jgi:WD40 repeat protein